MARTTNFFFERHDEKKKSGIVCPCEEVEKFSYSASPSSLKHVLFVAVGLEKNGFVFEFSFGPKRIKSWMGVRLMNCFVFKAYLAVVR